MIGKVVLIALFAAMPLGAAQAEERAKTGSAAGEHSRTVTEPGLESIADEAAEVGRMDDEPDGMSKTVDEMMDAEGEDGCTGEMAEADFECEGG